MEEFNLRSEFTPSTLKTIDEASASMIRRFSFKLAIIRTFNKYNIFTYMSNGSTGLLIEELNKVLFRYQFKAEIHDHYIELIPIYKYNIITKNTNNISITYKSPNVSSILFNCGIPVFDNIGKCEIKEKSILIHSNELFSVYNRFDNEGSNKYLSFVIDQFDKHKNAVIKNQDYSEEAKDIATLNDDTKKRGMPLSYTYIEYFEECIKANGSLLPKNSNITYDDFSIKDIKFSNNKMIVFWKTGDKTIITHDRKTDPKFDLEKAIYAAITKRVLTTYGRDSHERSMIELVEKANQFYENDKKRSKEIAKVKADKAKKKAAKQTEAEAKKSSFRKTKKV